MSERATVQNTAAKATMQGHAAPQRSAIPSLQTSANPYFVLQQGGGNQAMLRFLEAGTVQAKLRVSQPGDPDEQEADRVADQIVTATHAPKIQRKCACEGTGSPCAKCEEEEIGTIHRSLASPSLRSSQLAVQRAPASDSSAKTPDQAANPPKPSPTPAHTHPLVVEDDAKSVGPHQMRKSAFIALLRSDACATADAVLISVGHTAKSCPYIEKWLAFYEKQSSEHIERAILKYAPETANARSAHEAIRLVVMRVQRAAMTWAKTGKVTGLPEDLASQLPGQGFLGAVHSFASSAVGGAILGFLGGSKPEKSTADTTDKSSAATVSRKANDGHSGVAPAHDAGAVRSQLGAGHSLDSRVQSQMSSAFGHDFSAVRIHTDARASSLSSDLDARAFTIGTDVAFASGEYQPGTPVGDALIAHELAHVIQQSAATRFPSPMQKAANGAASATDHGASQLENDADLSAVGAIASIWAGAKRGLSDLRANAIPRLRSGLRLQRCKKHDLEIRGIEDPHQQPDAIFFDLKSSDLDDPDQKDKIQPLKSPIARDLTLTSFVSEDENSPPEKGQKLASERAKTVDKALRSDPGRHTGPRHQVLDTTSSLGNLDYRSMRKVVVKTTGAPTGVPSCGAGGEIACSDPSLFTSAQTRADALLTTAISQLTGPLTDPVKAFLHDRFGAQPGNIVAVTSAVKTNLEHLQTHIGTQMTPVGSATPVRNPGHRCANECEPHCKPRFVAYNHGLEAAALMTLCDNSGSGFMNEPDLDKRAFTLIHEGMHGTSLAAAPPILPVAPGMGTKDFSYHFQRLITMLDPATALKNTDSYVLLVKQLNGMTPDIGPGTPDPEVGEDFLDTAPGGEREQVDRAVAWLQGWVTWSWQEMAGIYKAINDALAAGTWPAGPGYYKVALQRVAPIFGLSIPPAPPKDTDKFAIAAIHDRLATLAGVFLKSSSIEIEKVRKGSTTWEKGPAPPVKIGSDFFAFPAGAARNRRQLDLLLLKMLEAHPDISSSFRPKYMATIDTLREHFGGGSP